MQDNIKKSQQRRSRRNNLLAVRITTVTEKECCYLMSNSMKTLNTFILTMIMKTMMIVEVKSHNNNVKFRLPKEKPSMVHPCLGTRQTINHLLSCKKSLINTPTTINDNTLAINVLRNHHHSCFSQLHHIHRYHQLRRSKEIQRSKQQIKPRTKSIQTPKITF